MFTPKNSNAPKPTLKTDIISNVCPLPIIQRENKKNRSVNLLHSSDLIDCQLKLHIPLSLRFWPKMPTTKTDSKKRYEFIPSKWI